MQIVFKMKPLSTTERILIWLCMCPPKKSTNECKKRVYFVFAFVVFISFLFSLVAHIVYITEFFAVNLPGCLFAFLGVIGFWGVMYIMMAAFIMRQKMGNILENLSTIYDGSECDLNCYRYKIQDTRY